MKKTRLISKKGLEDISRMPVKKLKKYGAIILMAVIRIIKGKLGFGLRTTDGTFLFNARAISTALKTNANGFYDPTFPDQTDLDNKIDAFNDAIEYMSTEIGR